MRSVFHFEDPEVTFMDGIKRVTWSFLHAASLEMRQLNYANFAKLDKAVLQEGTGSYKVFRFLCGQKPPDT